MCWKRTGRWAGVHNPTRVNSKPRGYKSRRVDVAFYATCVSFVRVLKVQMPQGRRDSADHDTHANAHDPHSRNCCKQDVLMVQSRRQQRLLLFWRTGSVTTPPRQHATRCCFIKGIADDNEWDTTIGSFSERAHSTFRLSERGCLPSSPLLVHHHRHLSRRFKPKKLPADVTSEAGQVSEGRGGMQRNED